MLSFLLTIANESDREKIEYIYYKYHNDMIRFTRCRLKNANVFSYESAAEDVVQNSFLKIVKYIDAIDFTRSEKELKSYIFSIVANEINNYKCDIFEYDDIENFSNNISDDDFLERLQIRIQYDSVVEKIKQLDEKYSITLMFYYCEKMDVKAISNIMGIAEKTVYTRLERGKRLLLEDLLKEDKM